jgi:hypothetical protein
MKYEFTKPDYLQTNSSENLIFQMADKNLQEERQAAAGMMKLAEKQIETLQQRINFWNEIRKQNKAIAYGQ